MDDPPIYAEMVDKARRAGTSAPEGTELAMAWAPDTGRVAYGGHQDWAAPARESFLGADGARYARIDPDEIGAP
jgi:hypothetical protein